MKLGRCQTAIYAAEADLHMQSRLFGSVEDAQRWLDPILDTHELPDVHVAAIGGRWSGCNAEAQVIHLAQPFRATTLCHELAHFMSPTTPAHGQEFAQTYLELVRTEIGFFEYAAFLQAIRQTGAFK